MRIAVLLFHALLILLASTSFTVVTSFVSGQPLQWCPFRYSYENGFGYDYQSDFTLPVITTYLLAFFCGLVGFAATAQRGHRYIGRAGMILSAIGLVSFAVEFSHVIIEHNFSWLAFSPAAMLLLVVMALIPQKGRGDSLDTPHGVITSTNS